MASFSAARASYRCHLDKVFDYFVTTIWHFFDSLLLASVKTDQSKYRNCGIKRHVGFPTIHQRSCPSDYIRHKLYEFIIIFERRLGGSYYGHASLLPVLPWRFFRMICFSLPSSSQSTLFRVFLLIWKRPPDFPVYYINFSELQGFLLLWKHDIFTCEDKFVIFTCEDNNDVVCAITFTKFNCRTNLNSFLCDRSIFDDSLETFGNLRQSSAIFGHLRTSSEIFGKWSEMFVWTSDTVRRILKIFGNLRKIAKISLMLLFI